MTAKMTPQDYEKLHEKCLVIDLDGTLTIDDDKPYAQKSPNAALIAILRTYHAAGWRIIIYTSRAMRSFCGDVAQIKSHAAPEIIAWLRTHKVPYDELVLGKPWCGRRGFYVNDRALRPSEFVGLSFDEINALLEREKSLASEGLSVNFNAEIGKNSANLKKNSLSNAEKFTQNVNLKQKSLKNSQKSTPPNAKSVNLKQNSRKNSAQKPTKSSLDKKGAR